MCPTCPCFCRERLGCLLSASPWCARAGLGRAGSPGQHFTAMGFAWVGICSGCRSKQGWGPVGTGMQRLATSAPLPALYLRVILLLLRHQPCCVHNQTPRLCLQHWLLPSLSLLFLSSKISVCPRSPLALRSIWAPARWPCLRMAAGTRRACWSRVREHSKESTGCCLHACSGAELQGLQGSRLPIAAGAAWLSRALQLQALPKGSNPGEAAQSSSHRAGLVPKQTGACKQVLT